MKPKKVYLSVLLVSMILPASTTLVAQKNKTPVRESIEWLDVWMPNSNDSGLPRVLLIGNSITRGYYPQVQQLLAGKAYVARLTTSKSIGDPGLLQEIDLIMGYYRFDIVHFNNGLHGWGYSEEAYRKAFPAFIKRIRKGAPHATLIWATTTPVRNKTDINMLDAKCERIKARNRISLDFIATNKHIRIDDLWDFAINRPELYQGGDGTHPNPAGFQALGQQVATVLMEVINKK